MAAIVPSDPLVFCQDCFEGCYQGPPAAVVTNVSVGHSSEQNLQRFDIRQTA
jgi:hypothetical protein